MRVWVTRAEPGATATARRLREMGHEPVVRPVLEVRALPGVAVDLADVAALAFTSANGVEAFAALSAERSLPVFAVGAATAAAACSAGFAQVQNADGDVKALADLIGAARIAGTVLHPGALEPAGDLAGGLAAKGVSVRALPLYETAALAPAVPQAEAVLIHSPKAARVLARLVGPRASRLRVFALSPACAAPLAACDFANVNTAALPNEASLLTLLGT